MRRKSHELTKGGGAFSCSLASLSPKIAPRTFRRNAYARGLFRMARATNMRLGQKTIDQVPSAGGDSAAQP